MGKLFGDFLVRPATSADEFAVIRLLRDAHAAAGFGDGTNPFQYPFHAAYAQRAFQSHVGPDALRLILEVEGLPAGILMARAFDYELGPVRVAKETAWWIAPEHRGKAASEMLDAYEAWAASRGANAVGMAALTVAMRAEIIYRRRGYAAVETHYLKAVA